MPKVLKFATGTFVNDSDETCILGSLARAAGRSIRWIRESRYSIDPLVMKRFNLTQSELTSLVRMNDDYKWPQLTNKLLSLELYHVVRPFAKNVKSIKTVKKPVTIKLKSFAEVA